MLACLIETLLEKLQDKTQSIKTLHQNAMGFVIRVPLCLQFVYHEALVTAISDMYPSFFKIGHRRKILLLLICIASFLVGLLMVTEVKVQPE